MRMVSVPGTRALIWPVAAFVKPSPPMTRQAWATCARSSSTTYLDPFHMVRKPVSLAMLCLHLFSQVHTRDLMRERDLAPLFGGLQHGEADFERCFAPTAVEEGRPIFGDCRLQGLQFGGAAFVLATGNLLASVFTVDEESVGRLANDAMLAGNDGDAK